MTNDHWFKPKTHGYGAYPTHWKGWALTLGFVALQLGVALAVLATAGPVPSLGRIVLFVVATGLITATYIWMAQRRTDGEWRWRWPERAK